mgnify:CR=1 FL=1
MKKFVFIILFVLSFATPQKARSQDIIPDNLGKDFWIVFPPNFHNERNSESTPTSQYRDSLFILVTVAKPTNVYIERMNRNGILRIDTVFISQINTVKSFSYPWFEYELIGFNDSGKDSKSLRQDETISMQYFRVSSDEDIGVYAFNNAQTTTDATLVLPFDALSNAYRIAAYNSHRTENAERNTSTPSQFVVLAVLDSTYVTISPSVRTMRGKTKPFTIMLNRGESYLIQSDESSNFYSDISGTNILSSKRIAVFSGHQRALIPYTVGTSRDNLWEQLPGIAFWGKSAVVVPFNNDVIDGYDRRKDNEKDLYRIFAHYDSTEIFVDGQFVKRIESGQFYEAPLLKASSITSNKAIMAMAYKSTSNLTRGVNVNGDPFMALMPPTIQFLTRYTFLCPTTTGRAIGGFNNEKVYPIHYLNIVVPDKSLDSVYLDNVMLPRTTFTSIPNSGFSYAILNIKEGVHTLRSNQAIGGFVYGYGNAISYGYGLGLRFKKIDNNEPVISGKRDCYQYDALIFDTLFADSYIEKIFCPDSTNINIKIENQFGILTQKGGFRASLANPFLDGSCFVIAQDSMQQQARKRVVIPGFTVSVQNKRENTFSTMEKTLRTNRRFCFPVIIENYGNFRQTITSLKFKNIQSGFSLSETLPITLQPKDKKVLTVCFYNTKDTLWNDTLVIINDCIERDIQAFAFKAITDKSSPQSVVSSDDCLRNWEVILTEINVNDIGIYDIVVPDSTLINCTASVQITDSSIARVIVSIVNEFDDAEFTVIAKDSSENISTIKRTIPGYTLQFTGKSMDKDTWNFGNVPIGGLRCDSVLLYNFGKFPIDLQQFSIKNNVYFSIPPSQFPINIPPGDSVPIVICYEPKYVQNTLDADGITLPFKCIDKQLEIVGNAVQLSTLQAIQCDIPLKINAIGDKQPLIKQLYPLPASDNITIDIESFTTSQLQCSIIDNTGVTICTYNTLNVDKGLYSIQLPLNNIVNGVYYVHITDGLHLETKPISVMR